MTDAEARSSTPSSTIVAQYETLRSAVLGEALSPHARSGLIVFLRYRCMLPTGFAYHESGNVVLDPDSQIRETIARMALGQPMESKSSYQTEGAAV
jgi:hypothetical protein